MKEPYVEIIEMMKYACATLDRFNKNIGNSIHPTQKQSVNWNSGATTSVLMQPHCTAE